MSLVLLVDLLSMLFVDGGLGIAELPFLLQLLLLKSLIPSSILKHSLRVFVTASFHLGLVLIVLHFQLLVKLLLNLVLSALHLIDLSPNVMLKVSLPGLPFFDLLLLLVGRVFVVDSSTARIAV